jgi:hypothetical protein
VSIRKNAEVWIARRPVKDGGLFYFFTLACVGACVVAAVVIEREFPVTVRNSEKIALCDPVMPVTDSFRG